MEVADVLQRELEALKQELVDKYKELGMRASGMWEYTLDVKTLATAGGLRGVITGAGYTYYMQHGRKEGRMPPIQAIEHWILARGIQPISDKMSTTSLAWAIAKKISKEGTKRFKVGEQPPFIDAVITPERVQQIIEKVGYKYLATFTSEIINFLKEIKI